MTSLPSPREQSILRLRRSIARYTAAGSCALSAGIGLLLVAAAIPCHAGVFLAAGVTAGLWGLLLLFCAGSLRRTLAERTFFQP